MHTMHKKVLWFYKKQLKTLRNSISDYDKTKFPSSFKFTAII